MNEFDALRLIALIMIAGLVFPGFLYAMKRLKASERSRNLALWLGIALIVAVLYQFFGGG
ncbi:MAG: hypothetical protein V7750_17115 [Sneathiella sp.]